jgi:multidrug efflux pump subunit AcrA (membrane-fusion protein)
MRFQILTMLALAALVISCSGNQSKSDEPVHSVMLVQPEGVAALGSKTFSGLVEEGREISVGFKTAGQLTRILVKEGDYVRQGQLIAQLDDKDYKLGVDAAQIQYDQMKREVARMKKLYDNKSL